MLLACLSLNTAGGEAMGDASQVWICVASLGIFALSLYMVGRLVD